MDHICFTGENLVNLFSQTQGYLSQECPDAWEKGSLGITSTEC